MQNGSKIRIKFTTASRRYHCSDSRVTQKTSSTKNQSETRSNGEWRKNSSRFFFVIIRFQLLKIVVVAVMCKPHRCPHIAMTGNICVYCPGGPDSDFEYSTQSYTGYEVCRNE